MANPASLFVSLELVRHSTAFFIHPARLHQHAMRQVIGYKVLSSNLVLVLKNDLHIAIDNMIWAIKHDSHHYRWSLIGTLNLADIHRYLHLKDRETVGFGWAITISTNPYHL